MLCSALRAEGTRLVQNSTADVAYFVGWILNEYPLLGLRYKVLYRWRLINIFYRWLRNHVFFRWRLVVYFWRSWLQIFYRRWLIYAFHRRLLNDDRLRRRNVHVAFRRW